MGCSSSTWLEQSDPDRILAKVAEAVGVPISGSALESLSDAFAHERLLVVLDNFEQLVGGAHQVVELLVHSPGVNALVTSRVALRVQGEFEYRVEPLEVPADGAADLAAVGSSPAVRLFAERARAVRPGFEVTADNAGDLAGIARRLDGLPLAIELAAARLRMLTPTAPWPSTWPSPSTPSARDPTDSPERQQTLRSTIDWSHTLLTDQEQRVFRRLTVLAGSWSFEAARAICGDAAPDIVEAIESLVDKSLVRVDTAAETEPRFRMLLTIREYGAERLRDANEDEAARYSHARYFLAVAERWGPRLKNEGHSEAMHALDLEWDDVLAAAHWFLEQGRHEALVRIGYSVWIYPWLRGHVSEILPMIEDVAETPHELAPTLHARALCLSATGASEQGDYARARELVERSIDILGETNDDECLAWARTIRATTLPAFGADPRAVAADLADALERSRSLGDGWGESLAHANLGIAAVTQGDIEEALRHAQAFLAFANRLQIQAIITQAHSLLGFIHLAAGDRAQARTELAVAVDMHRSLHFPEGLAQGLDCLAGLAIQEGDPNRAMIAVGAAEAIRARLGVRPLPSLTWFLDSITHAADAIDDPNLQASRTAGRLMEPLAAAAIALQSTSHHQPATRAPQPTLRQE